MENHKEYIKSSRMHYSKDELLESVVAGNPFEEFGRWFQMALNEKNMEPHAMDLATVGPDGFPSARIVLLRDYDENGFTFFTNYLSHKGNDIAQNPKVTLNFFWPQLQKQIRITGLASKVDEAVSDEYFKSRPRESQIGAWASNQSKVIESRETLAERVKQLEADYEGKEVPRPQHWGGYVVKPLKIEFWQGRPSRLHDRILYTLENQAWKIERLSP
jgi:pyridoxamine 5'-phosphate oxidase